MQIPTSETQAVAKPASSNWFKGAIIYQLHIKTFCDANNDGIGDFQGLLSKLDYLRNLGVTVITELVLNHTSDQHIWFQRSRRAVAGDPWRDYYVWSDDPNKYQDARIIFKDTELSNWTYDPVAKSYFWHRFYSHQPDLNYDNPEVCSAMYKVVDFWLDMGVDGLRLDAVPYLFQREGTSCENLPETHEYLQKVRAHIDDKYVDRMLLAEANQWPDDAVAYFGTGNECHMAFNFPIMPRIYMSLHMEDRYPLVDILDQTPNIPENCQWAIFLRNHDELTLEMVTEEERDYMYRVYARDPRARINLGDRNSVRTPMQWSADKNAGFSRANPHSLFLPVNIDPEFHYEAVNVEVQETNLSSFLWWMRRIIAMRKRFPAFGHGDFRMLFPSNNKVLAFTRTYETQTILVVINLARFTQAVELDLQPWVGWTPEDAFGHGRFPVIRDTLYPITLGPTTFYWLLLTPPEAGSVSDGEKYLPTIAYDGSPAWWYSPAGTKFLERDLIHYMRGCRWYRSKSRSIVSTALADLVELGGGDSTQFLLVAVNFSEGARDLYALPVKLVSGDEARSIEVEYPGAVIAKVGAEGDLLVDAVASTSFQHALLHSIVAGGSLTGRIGKLSPSRSKRLLEMADNGLPEISKTLKVEQSNSSIIYGEQIFLKLFRKLDEGLNPDLEVTKQLSERCGFAHVPSYLGDMQYITRGQDPAALAMAQAFTNNEQEGWTQTLAAVDRYFDRVLGDPTLPEPPKLGLWDQIPEQLLTVIEGVHLETVRLLGQRTAEMHLALAADADSPDFRPEPFTLQHQRSVYQSIRSESKVTMTLLGKNLNALDEYPRALADQVLSISDKLMSSHEYLLHDTIHVHKIRVHGDYHLGQILFTGKDYVILDFEGEPARPLGERRLKRSALIDIAGMLRSFHYAAHYSLFESRTVRPEDRQVLGAFADLWATRAGQVFLGAYLEAAANAVFVPFDRGDLRALLRSYSILKAMYELRYELNNRPKWTAIPLRGLLQVVEG